MRPRVGERYYRSIDQEPWLITKIEGHRATLIRTCEEKTILVSTVSSTYTRVGSAKDVLTREAFRRHGWPVLREKPLRGGSIGGFS